MKNNFNLRIIKVGFLQVNCYIVSDPETSEAVIIDPGDEGERIVKAVNEEKVRPVAIVNTHGHGDHIGANLLLKKIFGARIHIHEADEPFLANPALNGSEMFPESMNVRSRADVLLKDGSEIIVGKLVFKVLHTPGHTPGGICLSIEGAIFTGDTLFRNDVGRTDLHGGDEDTLMRSLKVFSGYPSKTVIYPGHGPSSTLKYEFANNQYFL